MFTYLFNFDSSSTAASTFGFSFKKQEGKRLA